MCWPRPGRSRASSAASIADDAVDAGEEVGNRDARPLRRPVRLAGDVHEAGHALHQVVVARPFRVGAGLAEAGDRAIDEARLSALRRLVVEAVFPEAADLEVLDEHVGARGEAAHDLAAPLGREVGDDPRLPRLQA